MHPSLRAAEAFENTLRNMTLFILDGERIVGNVTEKVVGVPLPVERGEMNLVLEMDIENLRRRERQPYEISDADRDELLYDIIPYWRGKTVRDGKYCLFKEEGLLIKPAFGPLGLIELVRNFGAVQLYESLFKFVQGRMRHLLRASAEIPVNNPNLVNNVFDVQGHLVVGHNRVIHTGFSGVRDRAAEILRSPLPEGKKTFLESVVRCCESAKMFAGRYAELARGMAATERDNARREELLAIAARANRVPWLPPRNFAEAVQSLWFTQAMAVISTGMAGINAIGRPDQYLYPYYSDDPVARADSGTEALSYMEELLIKLSNNLIALPSFGKDTGSELGADSMAPTFGGVGSDGEDATNELSYLFLDAVANIKGMSNSYSVRISDKTPAAFKRKVTEVHAVTSGLAVFNDEVIVPSLERCDCTTEDARDYAVIGCVEPTPQGSTFGCTSGNDISLVGVLEMALTRGRIRMTGRRTGPLTADPAKFGSFDDLMGAFRAQLAYTVDLIAKCVNAKDRVYAAGFHNPFISSTLDGCIENAEDMTEGGAKYNFSSISARGLGTVADSLSAVRKYVFDEKKLTMDEMMRALRTNFRGREDLRMMLSGKSPKYGVDDDAVDSIAKEVAEAFCEEVKKQRSVRKDGLFRPGFFSYGMHVMDGSLLGATPDGRHAGAPVSNSLSPSNGAEIKGPTAALRSAAKIDHVGISNGASFNMKLMPAILSTNEGKAKFEALIGAYFNMGGMHIQVNIVDDEMLRDAQRNPEAYRDLVVRVSGYSAYFTDLGRPLQDDIIRRTSFSAF